jgi:hypothetical protein
MAGIVFSTLYKNRRLTPLVGLGQYKYIGKDEKLKAYVRYSDNVHMMYYRDC